MLDLTNVKETTDSEVIFYDGFLYIISRDREPFIDKDGFHDAEYSINVKCLNAEYDEPWTLADIARKYPNVQKVIFDDALKGSVYNYGNHKGEEWEKVGTTKGYA